MKFFAKLLRTIGLIMIVGSSFYIWWFNQNFNQINLAQPTAPLAEEKKFRLISARFLPENCNIQIETTEAPILIKTGFQPGISKCEQFSLVLPSPSGEIVAFEDLSAGIDSWLKIYSAKYRKTFGVEVLGTSSILSMAFLPDNRLAVLHGYGLSGEQWLRVYDLPQLVNNFDPKKVANQDSALIKLNEVAVSQATKIVELPKNKKSYHYLQFENNQLKLFGVGGVNGKVLAKFDINQI